MKSGAHRIARGETVTLHSREQDVPVTDRISRERVLKRFLDVALASAALILLSGLIGIVALAIKLESPGPIFYRSRRVGLGGREFLMLKFRKMAAAARGPALTAARDERFTRIGKFLATTKLDEIPQLWNVVTGSMSLVGPRPEDPSFVRLRQTDYEQILEVKPGITGLSQLAFARESEILDTRDPVTDYVHRLLPRKVRIDRMYVTRRTVLMDLRILGWTPIAVLLRREVAVHRSTGRLSLRRRPAQLVPQLQGDEIA
jgi:lipopolysaccharide/colanic/teichoic acid biosynthesis glycosyltransferase